MKIRRINPFLIAYVIALVALAGLGYMVGDFTIKAEHMDHVANNRFVTDVNYVNLPRMNFSIASLTGQTGHLRMDISLEVEKKNIPHVEGVKPIITDHIMTYVRKLDADDMHEKNAIPKLRKELLREINMVSYPFPVVDVVFRQFVIL